MQAKAGSGNHEKRWSRASKENFDKILKSGYVAENYRKMELDEKKGFDSLYFMELKISADELKTQVAEDDAGSRMWRYFPGEGIRER